jgi:chaperone required for assembly of F1-ATPase
MTEWAAKRFWKEARVAQVEGGYGVTLDGRPVRTPHRTALAVPSAAMAAALAEEWNAQGDRIDPGAMPVTRAANSAVDKVAPQIGAVAEMLAEYGGTDLLCYRAESPASLVTRQDAAWDPFIDWAARDLGAPLNVGAGVMHIAQPEASLRALRAAVDRLDAFELTALHDLVTLSGSLVLALAAERGLHPPSHLWTVSRVDEIYQAELWGHDEEAEAAAAERQSAFENAHRFLRLHRQGG